MAVRTRLVLLRWRIKLRHLFVPKAVQDSPASSQKPPWYEGTLLWGAISAVISLVGIYAGFATKDIRWFLVAAWPFCGLVSLVLARDLCKRETSKVLVVAVGLLGATALLFLLSKRLPPPTNGDVSKQIADGFQALRSNGAPKEIPPPQVLSRAANTPSSLGFGRSALQPKNPTTTHKPALEEKTLLLSEEIAKWTKPKFQERGKLAHNPGIVGEPEARGRYDESATAEFREKFTSKVNTIILELDKCSANTTELKQELSTASRVEHFSFISDELRELSRSIPEGQPECGTGQPHSGFGVRTDGLYTLELGQESVQYEGNDLEGGRKVATGFRFGNSDSILIYLRNGLFCANAQIFGGIGYPLIDVVCNRVKVPPGWDTNFTDKAMEVVDQRQVPMFQMILEAPQRMRVNGVFPTGPNQLTIFAAGITKKIVLDPTHPSQIEIPIKPLFKYPAWKYPGQYSN